MKKNRLRTLAILMLTANLAACTVWRPTPASPREAVSDSSNRALRVTTAGEGLWVVHGPALRNDSIHGVIKGERRCAPSAAQGGRRACSISEPPIGIPLSQVTMVEVESPNYATVAMLVVVSLVAMAASQFDDFTLGR